MTWNSNNLIKVTRELLIIGGEAMPCKATQKNIFLVE